MSQTPRTDAATEDRGSTFYYVRTGFARQLETELNEAKLIYQGRVSEMNDRLIERQRTLIEKGAECEEMRKALNRLQAELATANELLNTAGIALRETKAQLEAANKTP
jgi:chromosome segregation ATPase